MTGDRKLAHDVVCPGCNDIVGAQGTRVVSWASMRGKAAQARAARQKQMPVGVFEIVLNSGQPMAVAHCRCGRSSECSSAVVVVRTRPLPSHRCPCCDGLVAGGVKEVEVVAYGPLPD